MKISHIVSGLHNSTKSTVIACFVLLLMTAAVLVFLMLFPIQMSDRSVSLSAPPGSGETTATSGLPEAAFTASTKEPPHTLSTWAAFVETTQTTETTSTSSQTTDIPWYDLLFTTTVETDKYGNPVTSTTTETTTTETTTTTEAVTEEIITTVYVETEPPYIETEIITEMLTVPETAPETLPQTVTEVIVTEAPEEAPTEPMTEAPAAPPETEAEIINAEPTAPVFSNE